MPQKANADKGIDSRATRQNWNGRARSLETGMLLDQCVMVSETQKESFRRRTKGRGERVVD